MTESSRRLVGVLIMVLALAVPLLRADDRAVESLVTQWGAPPSQFIDMDGQLLHLRDEGPRNHAVPLLLLHGAGSSLHAWDGWVRALRGQYRLIRLDLPGAGLTGPWSGHYAGRPYEAESIARFVLDAMDRLRLQRIAVAGHGLGGEVAWRLALLAPGRVERLVLVSATGLKYQPEATPWVWQIARWPVAGRVLETALTRFLVRQALGTLVADPQRLTDAQVNRYYELALRTGNREALVQRARQWSPEQGVDHVQGLDTPTLVIWGGRDRIIPPQVADRLVADIPRARLARLDDLGHLPHEEDPSRSAAAVQAFLAQPP